MASPTSKDTSPAPMQKATPGIGKTDAAPPAPATTAEPTLSEGIDPVLLHRLFPEADSMADLESMALAQGRKTKEEGEKLVAAQQEPIP
jgi:hypothetical protein